MHKKSFNTIHQYIYFLWNNKSLAHKVYLKKKGKQKVSKAISQNIRFSKKTKMSKMLVHF